MLVSFLMPVYNKEVYLAESIEAVLGQTHKELELIIVDDKSYDIRLYFFNSNVMRNVGWVVPGYPDD